MNGYVTNLEASGIPILRDLEHRNVWPKYKAQKAGENQVAILNFTILKKSRKLQDWNLQRQKLRTLERRGNRLAITNTLAGRNLGMILLAIWLILTGLLPLLNIRVSTTVNTVLAVLAIGAGLLILLRR